MKNLCDVKDLKPDSYIASIRGGKLNCAFLFDDEKRFTRLWDGTYADSFFTGEYRPIRRVALITREIALSLIERERNFR